MHSITVYTYMRCKLSAKPQYNIGKLKVGLIFPRCTLHDRQEIQNMLKNIFNWFDTGGDMLGVTTACV